MRARIRVLLVLLALAAPTALATDVLLVDGLRTTLLHCAPQRDVHASGAQWAPRCVEVTSGDVVAWHGADLPHAVQTMPPPLGPRVGCFQSGTMEAGDSFAVRFTFDGTALLASLRLEDGAWSPARDCIGDADPVQTTPERAVLPFRCPFHDGMRGALVVHAISG